MKNSSISQVIPVIPSSDIQRDLNWYRDHVGFHFSFGDDMYAGINRDDIQLHLQFHHGTEDDPISSSVIKFFVPDIQPYFDEFLKRKTITSDRLRMNTAWGTHEFGFYDLNHNALFFVQDV